MGRLSSIAIATACVLVATVALVVTLSHLEPAGSNPPPVGPVIVREFLQLSCRNDHAPNFIFEDMTDAGPSLSWNVPFPAPVIMDFQNTVNYQLNGSIADTQWAALMPSKAGIVHLGPDNRPFMLSTFHQLRCLDIIRRSYNQDSELGRANPTTLTRHCMNYIRQMVLCRGDTRLERVVDPDGPHAVQIRDPQTCRDWRSLYSQVEKNTEMNS